MSAETIPNTSLDSTVSSESFEAVYRIPPHFSREIGGIALSDTIYFHGTTDKAAQKITKDGIRESMGRLGEGVYVTKSFDTAKMFARGQRQNPNIDDTWAIAPNGVTGLRKGSVLAYRASGDPIVQSDDLYEGGEAVFNSDQLHLMGKQTEHYDSEYRRGLREEGIVPIPETGPEKNIETPVSELSDRELERRLKNIKEVAELRKSLEASKQDGSLKQYADSYMISEEKYIKLMIRQLKDYQKESENKIDEPHEDNGIMPM
jgi:hypothetical protein